MILFASFFFFIDVRVVQRPFFQSASEVSHMKVEGDQSTSEKRTRRQIIE